MPTKPIIVTGTPHPNSWSQAYVYSFGSTEILLLISITQTGILDLAMYGNKLAEDIYQQLTQTLPSNLSQLKSFVQPFLNQAHPLNLYLNLNLIKNGYLTSVSSGQVQIQLVRQNHCFTLLSQPPQLTSLSGQLQPQDILLFTTAKLSQLITPNLLTLLKDKDLDETLNRLVHAQTDSSQLTGIIYSHLPSPPHRLKLPQLQFKFPRFRSNLKLKLRQPPSSKNKLLAIVLLLFFSLSLIFGFFKRQQLTQQQTFQTLNQTLNQNFDQINQLASTQPNQALDLFHRSQTLIETYLKQHPNSPYLDRVKNLNHQLQNLRSTLFHFVPVNPQIYLDLHSLTNNPQIPLLSLDAQSHQLNFTFSNQKNFILNLKDKSTLPLHLPFQPKDVRLDRQALFLLNNTGITRISISSPQPKSIIQADDDWRNPTFLDLYAGNIYILDKGLNEIWKYPVLNHGYGHRKRWLAPGIKVDFSKVIRFRIDGRIWILTSSGKLQYFLKGVPHQFNFSGVVSHLDQPQDFYLTDQEIFLLEPTNQRILVFSKQDGQYLRQYKNSQFQQAQQIFVDQNWLYFTHDHFVSRFPLEK